jgi:hypothetical protein
MKDHLVLLRFRPMWAYIAGTREFCRFFCATTFSKPDVAERVQLVIQELLENAIKFSADGSTCDVELAIRENDGREIEIAVSNFAPPQASSKLESELARIAALTPEEAYLSAVQRAATLPEGSSAELGLARIRFEGLLDIESTPIADGRIRITCRGPL